MPEPNPNDNILDNQIELPAGGDSSGAVVVDSPLSVSVLEDDMADVPERIHEQALSRLSAAGAQGHEHFVQFSKILDLSYENDRKKVSLTESLGVREVTSKSGQLGMPIAAGTA